MGDIVRKLIYGFPYRNYVDLRRGTFVENFEPSPVYFPAERHVRCYFIIA